MYKSAACHAYWDCDAHEALVLFQLCKLIAMLLQNTLCVVFKVSPHECLG